MSVSTSVSKWETEKVTRHLAFLPLELRLRLKLPPNVLQLIPPTPTHFSFSTRFSNSPHNSP
jgi:hypothetical protein